MLIKRYGQLALITSIITFSINTELQVQWHQGEDSILFYRLILSVVCIPVGLLWFFNTESHEQIYDVQNKPLWLRLILPSLVLTCFSFTYQVGYSMALYFSDHQFVLAVFMFQPMTVFILTLIFEALNWASLASFVLSLLFLTFFLVAP
eukprot:UN23977